MHSIPPHHNTCSDCKLQTAQCQCQRKETQFLLDINLISEFFFFFFFKAITVVVLQYFYFKPEVWIQDMKSCHPGILLQWGGRGTADAGRYCTCERLEWWLRTCEPLFTGPQVWQGLEKETQREEREQDREYRIIQCPFSGSLSDYIFVWNSEISVKWIQK